MSTTDILTACFEHLGTFVYEPPVLILWPNLQTEPPEEGVWLQPNFFPNEPSNRSWDNESCVEDRGFFQILVYYRARPKVGILSPSAVADALIDHFPKGTVLGPVRVKKRPWQSPAVVMDASKSFIPVTVSWLGLT